MELGKIFEGLYNKALGIFDRVVDLELGKHELDVAKDIKLFQQAQAAEDISSNGSFNSADPFGGGTIAGISTSTLLFGGLAVLAAFVLLRK